MKRYIVGAIALCITWTSPTAYGQDKTSNELTTPNGYQEQASALTVSVMLPKQERWAETILATGWLAAWQEAVISAEITAQRIVSVNADIGDKVQKGDILAELSHETIEHKIQQQEAALQSAQATLEQATGNADRARRLKVSGTITEQKIGEYLVTERKAKADLTSTKAVLASSLLELQRTHILAVDDGVISSRSGLLGDVVSSGKELFRLIRQSRIEWQAEVSLLELIRIDKGTQVVLPGPFGNVYGKVRQIAPTVSQTNGRVKVYVALTPPDNAPNPKTGILVNGYFKLGMSAALTVPSTALLLRDGFSYVFLLNENVPPTVSRKRVETARRQDERVEITSGITEKDRVVQTGGAFLADGSVVRVSETSISEGNSQ